MQFKPSSTPRSRRRVCFAIAALAFGMPLSGTASDYGDSSSSTSASKTLDLRVLVVSRGTLDSNPVLDEDGGLRLMHELLTELDVPFDVLDAKNEKLFVNGDLSRGNARSLTADLLASGSRGRYNGIILTDTQLYVAGAPNGSGFTPEEWRVLHQYERDFGVRESVLSGWPAQAPLLDLDYGLICGNSPVTSAAPASARWLAPAGGRDLFEYVNAKKALPITDYALTCGAAGSGPAVQPLLAVGGDPAQTLVSKLSYADGRQVLISTIQNASFLVHSQVLAYEFLNFATQGVFIGSRQVHFNVHLDDLFLHDELWNAEANQTDGADPGYRMSATDLTNAVAAQASLRSRHPLAKSFVLDFAFNGFGADLAAAQASSTSTTSTMSYGGGYDWTYYSDSSTATSNAAVDPLTAAVLQNKSSFRYINHSFTHMDLDRSNPAASYDAIVSEIQDNRQVWSTLGLPDYANNTPILVTGMHSGLASYGDPSTTLDDVPFPNGANSNLLNAARDTGVRFLASDPSRPNQDIEGYVPGYNLIVLPRWPTSVFFNVIDPAQLTDEYNWIFYERYFPASPCGIPGALCAPRSYEEILAAEAQTTLRHMLTYKRWPYYMHQTNLAIYGDSNCDPGTCRTLLGDWLEAAISSYESLLKLPLKSTPYYEIGRLTKERLNARKATIQATWNPAANTVTFLSNRSARIQTTGLYGGSLYGGQRQREIRLSANQAVTYTVDRALSQ